VRSRRVAGSDVAPPRAGPAAALEAHIDAMRQGDVAAVARSVVLTAEAKALIEAALAAAPPQFRRDYPTAEQITAFVFCGARRIESLRIASTTIDAPGHALQVIVYKFEGEPRWRTEQIGFTEVGGGWSWVVDVGVARRIASIIAGGNR
jgi:hypothetical protein